MRVLIFDDRGGFGPRFNKVHAVGGAEMHLVQIADYLASIGCQVEVFAHSDVADIANSSDDPLSGRPRYHDCRTLSPATISWQWDTIIVVGCSGLPHSVTANQTLAFQVVDPRPEPHHWNHLRGKALMVCVSHWQADLFRNLGHEAVVIPVPIPDEWYGLPRLSRSSDNVYEYGCLSSWNKGAYETIQAWQPHWGQLAVGSPYSHPPDVVDICRSKGIVWLGELRPREHWIFAMRQVRNIARVCTIGETFGVVDVAARAMGINSYTLCTKDVGSLREVGAKPFTDPAEWRAAIEQREPHPGGDAEAFKASRVLPRWGQLLGVQEGVRHAS